MAIREPVESVIPTGICHAVRAATGLPACAIDARLRIFDDEDWHRSRVTERCADCEGVVPPKTVEHNCDAWDGRSTTGWEWSPSKPLNIVEALVLLIDDPNVTHRMMQQTAADVVEGRLRFDDELTSPAAALAALCLLPESTGRIAKEILQTQLAATRERIEQIFAIRDDSHDLTVLAAEYQTLTTREAVLLHAVRGPLTAWPWVAQAHRPW